MLSAADFNIQKLNVMVLGRYALNLYVHVPYEPADMVPCHKGTATIRVQILDPYGPLIDLYPYGPRSVPLW